MDTPSLVRVWLAAARPKTLSAALGGVLVGTAFGARHGRLTLAAVLATFIVAIALQIAANLYNDYGDAVRGADTHERHGPTRAVAAGWLTPVAVRSGALVAVVVATLAGLYLVRLAGWPALGLGVAAVVSALGYTAGPMPLAYVGLGDLFVVAFFGGAAVCGTALVHAGSVEREVWLASLAVGVVANAILVVNNVRDRDTDARARKRTLVVRFGERFGRLEYAAMLALGYAIASAGAVAFERPGWLLPLVTLPGAWLLVRRVQARDGTALNRDLELTAMLGLAFNVTLAVGVSL
ncbi:MAG: 1,4-dihydroxy-2-naphthoate octaprenyltransferase [Myxococcales bacterium]|nr:1,4-dihydroxy-2-naphthoate octaprenyltransferase [Myxococcales bacterium]